MFLKLFFIEWTRLTRRAMFWITIAVSVLFIGFNQFNFYTANKEQLLTGDLTMPGFSFDLATSLDQIFLIALPFLIILGSMMMGNDYTQRTNQHWLLRGKRPTNLLSKFGLLVLVVFLIQLLTLLVGGGVGLYFKNFVYQNFSFVNVNISATLIAPFYMTIVTLPYIAFILLFVVLTRSTFGSIAIGLGFTQFIEILVTSIFYGAEWTKWMPRNMYYSATYMLNSIGNRVVPIPPELLGVVPNLVTAGVYTILILLITIYLYNRQDLGV